MATTEKMLPSTSTDLDVLIHSLEFENQQYVKMIEKENQRNQYFEAQEEEKQGLIGELQVLITSLEADTKSCHKQLVHNKQTLESLKKSKCVLQAHRDALHKQLEMLQFENCEELHEFEDTVQMYEKTWMDYEAQYKAQALYHKLQTEEEKLAKSQADQVQWQQKKFDLQSKIQEAKDELDFRDWQRFCIKIAEKRLSIERKREDLLAAVREKETLQAKLKEIGEKNTSVTLHEAQGIDSNAVDVGRAEKDVTENNASMEDITMCAGDGGDAVTHANTQKEVSVEGTSASEVERAELCSSPEKASDARNNIDSRIPAVIPFLASNTVQDEEMSEEDGNKITCEYTCPVQFEPKNKPPRAVGGPRPWPRKLPQVTPASSLPPLPLAVAVPRTRAGDMQRADQGKEPAPINSTQTQQVQAPVMNMKPPQISVPLLSIPRPVPRSVPPKIPSVRSAVSSLLSGGRPPETYRFFSPVVPRQPLPRAPSIAPPPPPVLPASAGDPPEPSRCNSERKNNEPTKSALSAPMVSMPALSVEQVRSSVVRSESSVPCVLTPSRPSSGYTGIVAPLPGRPADKQLSPPFMECGHKSTIGHSLATGQGAGDAPLLNEADKKQLDDQQENELKDSAEFVAQDEAMDSETDNTGLSQPTKSPALCLTPASGPSEGASSQGLGTACSPFDFDKHREKLDEIKDESDNRFNFQHRHFFSADENMHTEDTRNNNVAASASSIFNMTFASPATDNEEAPVTSVFRTMASPKPSSPAGRARPPSPNRDNERSGSFFSFEAMDTSEGSGSLSLLSMFGQSSKEPEPEPAFSFSFGGSTADSGSSSAFSFAFGGTEVGGAETSSSTFSLF